MRKSLVFAMLALLVCSSVVVAGVPDPTRSGCSASGQGTACHYRFRADGGLDVMTVDITLRDAFDTPVASCSTSVTLTPAAGTLALCSCCGLRQAGFTSPSGIISFSWSKVGGRGDMDVCVTAHCSGNIGIACKNVAFTSPDLDGSCESAPGSSTGVIDLGIWAQGISPYSVNSDYDCSGGVGVIDLGIWAGGLGKACDGALCPPF